METRENPDVQLLLALAPHLEETDTTSLRIVSHDRETMHLTAAMAAKLGFVWARDQSGQEFALIGIPELPACAGNGSLFDLLWRVRLGKAYMVLGEAAVFLTVKPARLSSEEFGFYAIRIPVSPATAGKLSTSKKLALCRMRNGQFDPNDPGQNVIEMSMLVRKSRVWESPPGRGRT